MSHRSFIASDLPDDEPTAEDPRVLAALQEYVAAVEAGQRPNRQEFLARHAEIAGDLSVCLGGLAFVQSAAAHIDPSATSAAAAKQMDVDLETHRPLGDFRLVREIGRGGMGIVYEAVQLSLGRRVAVKVLPLASALDPRHLQRFRNEAQAAAQLHHTNIVPVYAVGFERSVHFYAMQLIEGQSLAHVIEELRRAAERSAPSAAASADPLDPTTHWSPSSAAPAVASPANRFTSGVLSEAKENLSTLRSSKRSAYYRAVARLGLQAAEALEYAHQQGVVHRDIKPANLLLDARGTLWITDFGLAQMYADTNVTQTGDVIGTLRYMSPEQASGKAVVLDQRTDVYSLGITLYELLTLKKALPGRNREELLHQIESVDPPSPRTFDKNVPPELEIILAKATAKDPTDRYPTARALADDLERFLRDEPILARPPSMWDKAVKWTRRHKAIAGSAVVSLLVLTIGSLVSTGLIARAQGKTKIAYELESQRATEADQQRARAEKSFQQARQVVDFFTRIAANDMSNNPQFSDVRREMLEAALLYYQNFLDQRKDDASLGTELAAASSKVRSLLAELSASDEFFRANFRGFMLSQPAVRHDVQLTDEQAAKIERVNSEFPRRMAAFYELRQLDSEQKQQRLNEMVAGIEKSFDSILTPAQSQRVRQIALQAGGLSSLIDSAVSQTLGLTTGQKDKIRALNAEWDTKRHRPGPPDKPREPPEKMKEAFESQQKEVMAKALALLTPAQVQTWNALIGEPFHGPLFPDHGGGPFIGFRAVPREGGPPPMHKPHHDGPDGEHPPDDDPHHGDPGPHDEPHD